LGADKVIDYTKEDFTMNGESYDVIFETVNKLSFSNSIRSLKKHGTLILGASGFSQMLQGLWSSMTSSRKVISGMISQKADDIIFLKELIEKGNFKPVVDRSYPLESIVEAHRYVEQGHKKGSVAITLT
ncbi:MAG TPA: zinc-binding dehydrogenase, partial [Ginsengibacter sp.]